MLSHVVETRGSAPTTAERDLRHPAVKVMVAVPRAKRGSASVVAENSTHRCRFSDISPTLPIRYDMGVAERRRCEHVILYGPPGAGKLTVARVLAERYGMRVLDNHLSVDPALRLFDFGTREFADLVERIRVALLQAAARAGLDVVSTFVYAHVVDDDHLRTLVAASADAGAHVTLVQLVPSAEALEERVQAASRVGTTKITDPDVLRRLLVEYDLRTQARADDLVIDNTAVTAEDAAGLIADHVGLVPRRAEDPGAPDQRRITRRGG